MLLLLKNILYGQQIFVANFLAKNPSANINIVGYADEIGGENYNQKLSQKTC